MKKFVLKIEEDVFSPYTDEKCDDFTQIMKLKRNFVDLDIRTDLHFVETRLLKVVEHFGEYLALFRLESATLTLEVLWKILKNMLNLQELDVDICDEQKLIENNSLEILTMKKLKKMTVTERWNAFQILRAPSLVSLKTGRSANNFNPKSFEGFLQACPQLESIEVGLELFGEMENTSGFPFNLKEIIGSNDPFQFNEKIKKFLLSQAATVETLQGNCNESEFHEMVLLKFKRLHILNSNLSKLEASSDLCRKLQPLPLMTEIISYCGFSSESAMQAVLGNCPALSNLQCCDNITPKQLDFIANYNKKLEYLMISTIKDTRAKFPLLKLLRLERVSIANDLIVFLKVNKTIKFLNIESLNDHNLSSENLDFLINETKLEHIEIQGSEPVLNKVYNKIKSGFGTWKSLTLVIAHIDNSTTDWPSYHFDFPGDSTTWDPPEKLSDNTLGWDG